MSMIIEVDRAHYEKRAEWFERIGLAAVAGLVFTPLTSGEKGIAFVAGGLLAAGFAYIVR